MSAVLHRGLYPLLSRTGVLRGASRGLAVATYHGVRPSGYEPLDPDLDGNLPSADAFRRHLRALKARYRLLEPEEFRLSLETGRELPPGSVLLTCDDGLLNGLTEMVPILTEERARCLFFLISGVLEAPGLLWFDELFLILKARGESPENTRRRWRRCVARLRQLSSDARRAKLQRLRRAAGAEPAIRRLLAEAVASPRFRTLEADGARALVQAGMTVGSHGVGHALLSALPESDAWHDIASSRAALERATGAEIWSLAYPFGHPEAAGPREWDMARRAGYRCAFLNDGRPNAGQSRAPFALSRVHVQAEMPVALLEARLAGVDQALKKAWCAGARA